MQQYSSLFVVLMGVGTVFFGLICIIFLTSLMGNIMKKIVKDVPAPAKPSGGGALPVRAPSPAQDTVAVGIAPEIIAVITAVLSEDPNISSHGVNITSIKKL